MRTVLVAVLAATTLSGCFAFECGGLESQNDALFTKGNDALIVCGNGGFAAMLSTGEREGRFALTWNEDGTRMIEGFDGASSEVEFTLNETAGGTFMSAELGDGWTDTTLDEIDRDHAHMLCVDLETRTWW
jgi:hypothetical protein